MMVSIILKTKQLNLNYYHCHHFHFLLQTKKKTHFACLEVKEKWTFTSSDLITELCDIFLQKATFTEIDNILSEPYFTQ